MGHLEVGERAPDFALPSQSKEIVRLSDYLGKKNVVLYFYPKDFTPGCTAETKAFRESYQSFYDTDTEVIGVSSDSVETHQRFSQQCELPFSILSDATKQVRDLYGANSMLGMSGRVTFVIDKEGVIRSVFSSQLQPTRHVREALEAVKTGKSKAPKVI
jgi:thioredoxin-dependent peroxiredoxin